MSTISTANRQMFKRLLWIAMGFLVAALILSAVERKSTRNANEVLIQIRELPDGNTLVNREDILLTLERSFGHR